MGDRTLVKMALMKDGDRTPKFAKAMCTKGYAYAILATKSEQDSLSAAMGKGAVGTMRKVK